MKSAFSHVPLFIIVQWKKTHTLLVCTRESRNDCNRSFFPFSPQNINPSLCILFFFQIHSWSLNKPLGLEFSWMHLESSFSSSRLWIQTINYELNKMRIIVLMTIRTTLVTSHSTTICACLPLTLFTLGWMARIPFGLKKWPNTSWSIWKRRVRILPNWSTKTTPSPSTDTVITTNWSISVFSCSPLASCRYSFRSLEKFAPWIRKVYLVTNGQVPSWLDISNPRIQVVTHKEIFTNQSYFFSIPSHSLVIYRPFLLQPLRPTCIRFPTSPNGSCTLMMMSCSVLLFGLKILWLLKKVKNSSNPGRLPNVPNTVLISLLHSLVL